MISLIPELKPNHKPIQNKYFPCFLPEVPEQETKSDSLVPILGIFGTNDDVVPSFLAEHALEEMKNNGHSPTLRERPQGHELNAENLKELSDFFNS